MSEVIAEIPDWKQRLSVIEMQSPMMNQPCGNFPGSVCPELEVEIPLIQSSLVALKADISQLEKDLAQRESTGVNDLGAELFEKVVRIEGLLRRTEARHFALFDSFVGH
jgi:hypothetical protein